MTESNQNSVGKNEFIKYLVYWLGSDKKVIFIFFLKLALITEITKIARVSCEDAGQTKSTLTRSSRL